MSEDQSYEYYLDLPLDTGEMLRVRDSLENMIWEIAQQEEVAETFREANFTIKVGKPFPDGGIVLAFLVGFVANKVADKVVDKAMDAAIDKASNAWKTKVLPELQRKLQRLYGKKARLIAKEKGVVNPTEEKENVTNTTEGQGN